MTLIYTSYNAGDVIYEASDQFDSVFLTHAGEVDNVLRQNANLATLIEGEIFGEIG